MTKQFIQLKFGRKGVMFFMLLETLTVPLVAMSNNLARQNLLYSSIMGFLVAFIVILFLVRILKQLIIDNSIALFGRAFSHVSGLWYIGILAGILEMVMFLVQDVLFARGWGDFSCGFISALVSVGATLVIYELVALVSGFGINFYQASQTWQLRFARRDILLLALLFAAYEFIVCPITGWWIPYSGVERLKFAILSGIVGGGSGGLLLYCLVRFTPFKPRLTLVFIK